MAPTALWLSHNSHLGKVVVPAPAQIKAKNFGPYWRPKGVGLMAKPHPKKPSPIRRKTHAAKFLPLVNIKAELCLGLWARLNKPAINQGDRPRDAVTFGHDAGVPDREIL